MSYADFHLILKTYVGVNTKAGRVVIAPDNLYLYENLDKHARSRRRSSWLVHSAIHARIWRRYVRCSTSGSRPSNFISGRRDL